ncbi:DUF397 domain-containing protein [Saccharopolyspora sp. NFXS83]|uniref:DUF397 domain-containing protein n=1 Tax=Saccharopolyspora sp. NFXS83 TaxID=2993560 RepID=UPI00224A975A|nr:DUF397 domain-containing protein [Saccharopolyspora sp. NFXS83]MCX2729667.1 DUF397 domain-containing protein [Saccharopolyspora sp. NFXS83]
MSYPDFSTALWRKSSRSGSNGGACIEVAFAPSDAVWQKSSQSSSSGGQCIEVAVQPSIVGLRDSKDCDGPMLAVGRGTFESFLRAVKSGRM